jgi:peroxiredoxin
MSKQNMSKGNPAVRPSNGAKGAPNRPATRSAVPPPPSTAKKNGAATRPGPGSAQASTRQASARPMRTATGRANQVPAKRKTGFRLRPLDIALVVAGVLVIAFIVFSALQAPAQSIDPNAQITSSGTPVAMSSAAPDFTLPGIDGQTYTLSSFKGKPVVLEFMATWCPHCQADAPMMNQLDAAYKSKGVQTFGINATPYSHNHEQSGHEKDPVSTNDLKWFHDTYSVTFPMLFDKTLKSSNDYQVVSYPTIYIVDQNGKIAFQPPATSIPDYSTLSGALDKLLAAK